MKQEDIYTLWAELQAIQKKQKQLQLRETIIRRQLNI